jgi:hypothetical protein
VSALTSFISVKTEQKKGSIDHFRFQMKTLKGQQDQAEEGDFGIERKEEL